MQRRDFMRSALVTAGAATGVAALGAETGPAGGSHQEYYQLPRFADRWRHQYAIGPKPGFPLDIVEVSWRYPGIFNLGFF